MLRRSLFAVFLIALTGAVVFRAPGIDYIFFRSADRVRTKRAWIVNTLASDHVPVVADVEIGKH
jgi:endonuclease/exonuclease/phosphatase family metal-dependent hydrolase